MTPAVRGVIFDWSGTITPWHEIDVRAQWTAFADGAGTIACARDDLASALYAAEAAVWERGRLHGVSARLPEVLEACGLTEDDPRTRAGTAAYRRFWEPHTLTHPAIRPLWESLRRDGIRIGVLSNTLWDREWHRSIFERDDVLDLIDADVYSSETPWVKPMAPIFAHAARTLGVPPEECAYVGDRSYEDVHGPQQVGMRAIWIPHSDIPLDQQVSHEAVPDAVAEQRSDIGDIVARWNDTSG
ncbi:MAG: HAD family hydrolase [Micrococcales bacterium]|nr:HAD family hydrolase [Micrococcales bacterium]